MSLRSNSSCKPAYSAPWSAAAAAVRCRLQASTFIPKAFAIALTRRPSRPNPTTPSVDPARSTGRYCCHRPARVRLSSPGMSLVTAMIRAQVSSTVEPPASGVPHTVMPSSPAAGTSMDAFFIPVVTSSWRSGSRASRSRGNGVRSRMATTTANPANRSTSRSRSAR